MHRQKLLKRLAANTPSAKDGSIIEDTVVNILNEMSYGAASTLRRPRKTKLNVPPGKYVSLENFEEESSETDGEVDADCPVSGSEGDATSDESDDNIIDNQTRHPRNPRSSSLTNDLVK